MGHIKKSLQNRVKPPHQLLPRVPGHGCSQGAPHGAADRLRDAGKRMLSPSPRVFGLRQCAQPVVHGFHRGSGVDGVGPSGLQPLLSPCTHRVPPGASTGWPLAPAPARTWWGEALSLLCAGAGTSPGAKQPRHKPEPCPCQGGAARACLGGGPLGPGSACPPGLFVTASGLAQISRDPVSADLGASQAPLGAAGLDPGSVCILGQDPKPSTPM